MFRAETDSKLNGAVNFKLAHSLTISVFCTAQDPKFAEMRTSDTATWQTSRPKEKLGGVDREHTKGAAIFINQMTHGQTNQTSRVLIADDDPVIRRWLTSILEAEGYAVVAARDGGEVFRVLQSDANFKAAVFDLAMPCLNGPDLIRHMRSEKRLMRIPVIMITAESQIKLLESVLAAGATVLLPKPCTKAQLQNTLHMMIGVGRKVKPTSLPTNKRKSLIGVSLREDHSDMTQTAIGVTNSTSDADQPIDLQTLMGLEDGDDEEASDLITELIDLYLENAEREVKTINAAASEHNEKLIKERAHALRGSSSTIGACGVARLCERLEAASEQNCSERADGLAKKLESEFAAVRTALLAERRESLHLAGV